LEQQELKLLIAKYNSGLATVEERALIEQWYEDVNGDDSHLDHDQLKAIKKDTYDYLLTYIGANTHQSSAPVNGKIKTLIPNYIKWIAAAVFLICTTTVYYYNRVPSAQIVKNTFKNDIAPGGNKATLTLSNGTTLVLDNSKNGVLASQGKTIIKKTQDGLLTYQAARPLYSQLVTEVVYNTITTPRGGQYQVVLPDGSKVWLNAASSLKFPTSFSGKERNVELTGEAYFEVAKNKAMPFHVSSAGQVVEVLGTHFNINAYADETWIKTTLLEGAVKVTKGTTWAIIKPGQQSAIVYGQDNAAIKITDDVDTDEAVAWKNGKFYFDEADIQVVMRQVGRWYDVDVEYNGKIPSDRFSGAFSRNMNASEALRLLEFTGVNFKIEGRKIIVK
jgi:transmembrane sensor